MQDKDHLILESLYKKVISENEDFAAFRDFQKEKFLKELEKQVLPNGNGQIFDFDVYKDNKFFIEIIKDEMEDIEGGDREMSELLFKYNIFLFSKGRLSVYDEDLEKFLNNESGLHLVHVENNMVHFLNNTYGKPIVDKFLSFTPEDYANEFGLKTMKASIPFYNGDEYFDFHDSHYMDLSELDWMLDHFVSQENKNKIKIYATNNGWDDNIENLDEWIRNEGGELFMTFQGAKASAFEVGASDALYKKIKRAMKQPFLKDIGDDKYMVEIPLNTFLTKVYQYSKEVLNRDSIEDLLKDWYDIYDINEIDYDTFSYEAAKQYLEDNLGFLDNEIAKYKDIENEKE